MCGIVGYIGNKEAGPLIIESLKRLAYRGYDSAGIAILNNKGSINIRRTPGKITCLEEMLERKKISGCMGIGHTRWATHGRPTEENAHPHTDCTGKIVLVHNGIIENYFSLREKLQREGHLFRSDTDTEILAHLIEKYLSGGLEKAVKSALKEIKGSYALGIVSPTEPDKIIAARSGSPLIIGVNEGEYFLASDIPAILKYTRNIINLEDGEMAILSRKGLSIKNLQGKEISKHFLNKRTAKISWNAEMAEKEGYPHFMLKEIHEQPRAIEETIRGKISPNEVNIHFEEMGLNKRQLGRINRIIIIACGTSWHAGLVGEYLIEEFTRLPVEVENAAEFRYRNPVITRNTLVIAISQSGETADTLGAIREVHHKGGKVVSICNCLGSSIPRESDGVIYTHAGPEIGVASTKAFTTQLAVLYMLAIYLGRIKRTLKARQAAKMIADLRRLPQKIKLILRQERNIVRLSNRFYHHHNFLYLGRGKGFPVALEGALKLKEVSYIHAEGYPAAEMKHGPIALIDKNMPVVVIALKGRRYEKILANIEEVRARGGIIIALATQGDRKIKERVAQTIYIPPATVSLSPILTVIPLQLLAYYIAVKRGINPDQPRHLAKSVTVE